MNSNGEVVDTSVTKPSFLDVPQGIMSNRLEVDYKATWTPSGFATTMAAATITPITPITNIEIADTPSMNDQPMPKALQAALRAAAAKPIEKMPYAYTPPTPGMSREEHMSREGPTESRWATLQGIWKRRGEQHPNFAPPQGSLRMELSNSFESLADAEAMFGLY